MTAAPVIYHPITTQHRLTADDFMAQYADNPERYQLIEGEVISPPMAKQVHQFIITQLMWFLSNVVLPQQVGRLYTAPMDLYLDGQNYYQPDIFFVARDNPRCVLTENDIWRGPPDLVVEVLSKSTAKHDRLEKFDAYEHNGVREYWMIDPDVRLVEVYTLNEQGAYQRRAYADGDTFQSNVLPSLTIEVSALFPPEAPDTDHAA